MLILHHLFISHHGMAHPRVADGGDGLQIRNDRIVLNGHQFPAVRTTKLHHRSKQNPHRPYCKIVKPLGTWGIFLLTHHPDRI
jgi:hypothetical protein